jgi:hypothetical protein
MANRKIPNQETLRKLLDYDPETGVFTWKARTADMFAPEAGKRTYRTPQWYADIWNGRLAGKPAGSAYGGGYLGLAIQNEKYLAHRVAWVMHYGEQPTEIDHINGDRSDNRIANLRLVTRTENNMNSARQSNNTSGCQGVTWDKQTNRWRAFIKKDGRTIRLGRFDTLAEAAGARKRAERKLGFHENHGREATGCSLALGRQICPNLDTLDS